LNIDTLIHASLGFPAAIRAPVHPDDPFEVISRILHTEHGHDTRYSQEAFSNPFPMLKELGQSAPEAESERLGLQPGALEIDVVKAQADADLLAAGTVQLQAESNLSGAGGQLRRGTAQWLKFADLIFGRLALPVARIYRLVGDGFATLGQWLL